MSTKNHTRVLVNLVQQGGKPGRQALDDLITRYRDKMLVSIQYQIGEKLRRKVSSEDILQDSLLDVVKGIQNFDFRSDNSFLHYVNKIIANNIKDEAARYSTAKRDVGKEQSQALVVGDSALNFEFVERSPDARPSIQLSKQEDRELILKLLDLLEEYNFDWSQAVLFHHIEGLEYEELSAELEISVDAARMRVTRGREKMTDIYKAMKDAH